MPLNKGKAVFPFAVLFLDFWWRTSCI